MNVSGQSGGALTSVGVPVLAAVTVTVVLAIAGPLAASRSHVLARRLPARLLPVPALSGKDSP